MDELEKDCDLLIGGFFVKDFKYTRFLRSC